MRHQLLLAIVISSACEGADTGGPCSLDEPCDDGAICNLSAENSDGRTGICIDADADIDEDGLRNGNDFCNTGPGGAYDEDGDGRGDDCDRCPIARPLAMADADGDLVDAPCDPDPSTAGDMIVVFEGFNSTMPAGWKVAGTWEFRGGEVVATPPDTTTFNTLTAPLPLVTTRLAVLGQYRIDRVEAAAAQSLVGVTAIDRRPAGVSTVTCGGQRAGGADSLLLDTDTGAAARPFANLFDTASRYRVAQKLEGIQAACAMIADAEQGAVQQTTGGEAPTEAGLLVRAATARFQYLLVVQRPN